MLDPARIALFTDRVAALRAAISSVLVGQDAVLDDVLVALLAGGHVLLEGVPGLGKTLLVRSLADALVLPYARVQFTPDLMPADILGTHVLTDDPQGGRRLIFQRGPVFTSVLLADEVNRATPKTQSALLEAMAERQVTIGGTTHTLPQPFFVLATQNPLEMEGTYPLPEAQLDRFFVKVLVPFPDLDTLSGIVDRTTGAATPSVPRVLSGDELLDLQRMARAVALPDPVKRYAIRLVLATHPSGEHGSAEAKTWLRYGASPRGVQALVSGAKVRALLAGRVHASFDDVRRNALPVLRHRVIRGFDAEHEGRSADTILAAILGEVKDEGALADERAR